jgi:hypothetical protein
MGRVRTRRDYVVRLPGAMRAPALGSVPEFALPVRVAAAIWQGKDMIVRIVSMLIRLAQACEESLPMRSQSSAQPMATTAA